MGLQEETIEEYVKKLSGSLGIFPPVDETELQKLHENKNYAKMVGYVARSLRLHPTLRVGLVNSGGPLNAPAWIIIPSPIAPYGTLAFEKTLVTLYIRKLFLETAPFHAAVLAIAHELSHLVLHSIYHELKYSEAATDLTAMLLGYREFYRKGSQYKTPDDVSPGSRALLRELGLTRWVKIGYLSVDEIQFAADLIDRLYAEQQKTLPASLES